MTEVATTEVEPPKKKKRRRALRVPYSKEIAEKILKELEKGETLTKICEKPGMPTYASVQYWVRKGTHGFDVEYKRAKENQIHMWVDQAVDLADAPPPTPPDHLEGSDRKLWVNAENQRRRLKIDTIKFIAAKLAPNLGYGEQHGLNVQGDTINIVNYSVPKSEDMVPLTQIYKNIDDKQS